MDSEPKKPAVSSAAERALAEAAERRRSRKDTADSAKGKGEVGGRDGLDPARYGDWEKDGIASDF